MVILLATGFLLPSALADPESGQSTATLKPIAPQIDPNADIGHRAAATKALKGGVQHNEDASNPRPKPKVFKAQTSGGGFLGKLRGDAKTATTDQMKGKASNTGPLSVQATAGYGIIGVKFVLSVGRPPIINRVFAGTPAAQVGLLPNDAIIAVDGVPTFGLTKEEVYDLIIGSPGTNVNVSVQRGGDFRVVTCTRMDINDIADPLVRRDYMSNM